MNFHKLLLILSLGAILWSGGCGQNGGGWSVSGTVPSTFAQTVSADPSKIFNVFVGTLPAPSARESLVGEARRFVRRAGFRLHSSPLDSCAFTKTGTTTDADLDGVPVDSTYSVDCTVGQEKLQGGFRLRDEDDTVRTPNRGLRFDGVASTGAVKNNEGNLVTFTMDPSHFYYLVSAGGIQTEGTATASAAVGASTLSVGFQGSATYSGTPEEPAEGDTGTVSGFVRYAGAGIPDVTDATFTVSATAAFTVGVCPGSSRMKVKTGSATLEDSEGNKLVLTFADCVGTLAYNGTALTMNGNATLSLAH